MSDLRKEPTIYDKDFDLDEFVKVLEQSKADFEYWSRMSFWSAEEGIALLLGKDPELMQWSVVGDFVNDPCHGSALCTAYDQLRKVLVRSLKMKELKASNTPEVFLAWALMKKLNIPQGLQEAIAARHASAQTPSESDNPVIKAQAEEILALKAQIQALQQGTPELEGLHKRILELEASQWPGFDSSQETYAEELVIALQAHKVLSRDWNKGRSIKQQLLAWLEQHHPKLSIEAKKRIAKVVNWKKEGGAPLTP